MALGTECKPFSWHATFSAELATKVDKLVPQDYWPLVTEDCAEFWTAGDGTWNDHICNTDNGYSHSIAYACKVKAGCGDGTWYNDDSDTWYVPAHALATIMPIDAQPQPASYCRVRVRACSVNCPRGTYGATVNLDDPSECTDW